MCNGLAANSTIETCNSCNCLDNGWMDHHVKEYPDKPMIFTENEGWFQQWGGALAIRTTSDIAYSVAEWFAGGGTYHAYYMWHRGNNYGRTAASGITTLYADDVCLHADGTPNEPKYTQLSRLQHLIADHAEVILSQNATRTPLPWWNGKQWTNGSHQFVYSYLPSTHFIINQIGDLVTVLFKSQSILMSGWSVRIYDDNVNLLWDSTNYSDIHSDNTKIFPVVVGPLQWRIWSEPTVSNLPVISSPSPLEQLNITNDETIYLWYRRNITLEQTSANTLVKVRTRPTSFEQKGILGSVWFNGQLLFDNETSTNFWQHQKGLVGEYFQIYTEQGSSKVDWNSEWTKGINKPITWFQARFDLDHLVREDTNANPVLLDAQGLKRGHAFINGNDLGLYWLIQGVCLDKPNWCQQAQINCLQPTQRYYHIPSDWLMPKNNLITIFDDLGAPSPGSLNLVQRVVTK